MISAISAAAPISSKPTQAAVQPPTFVLFVNSIDLMHFSYERYLENQIRRQFGFEGTPMTTDRKSVV